MPAALKAFADGCIDLYFKCVRFLPDSKKEQQEMRDYVKQSETLCPVWRISVPDGVRLPAVFAGAGYLSEVAELLSRAAGAVVPVYNVEKYLKRCVDSIRSQTLEDMEIILVDDGTPDNSGALCDAWAKRGCPDPGDP